VSVPGFTADIALRSGRTGYATSPVARPVDASKIAPQYYYQNGYLICVGDSDCNAMFTSGHCGWLAACNAVSGGYWCYCNYV